MLGVVPGTYWVLSESSTLLSLMLLLLTGELCGGQQVPQEEEQ